jgi:hypothetical protein
MPKKYVIFFKTIGRNWFFLPVVIIVILAIYQQFIPAIVLSAIFLVLFLLSYIPALFFKNRLTRSMKKYYRIDDVTLSRKLEKKVEKIREEMFQLSQNQESKSWLIVFLNKQYIFYHENTIEKFKELYNEGYTEKEVFDKLVEYELKTRAEVKAILENLIRLNRISEREISVKEHLDKQRFIDFD